MEPRRSWLMTAFLPLLLLGAPWVGVPELPTAPDTLEPEQLVGVPVVISLDTHWTSEAWNSLREEGMEPLRQLTPNKVLAWDLNATPALARTWDVTAYEGGAEYRAALASGPFTEHRVVLEPRLPHTVQQRVFGELSDAGFIPEWIRTPTSGSPLPAALQISTPGALESWWPAIESAPGIRWVEPVLETKARNDVAASIMEQGETSGHPAWLYGIDGSGIVIANADSGLDRDHACFRDLSWPEGNDSNATGTPGTEHRKLVHVNESLDDWDTPGDEDYRHGTHVAGSLVCRHVNETAAEELGDWLNATPRDGTSLSHSARLLLQDLVNDEGWVVPGPGELLWEATDHGAVIHSDSWGDDTTAYTLRTHDFDAWAMQVPWSLALIAPGNTGGEVLEPANGLNVVSVGVAAKDGSSNMWSASPKDATTQGRQGVLVAAPGTSVLSAGADDLHESWNDGMRSSSGSSMATPQAAAFAALLQQLVEDGWLTEANENRTNVSTGDLRPGWADLLQTNLTEGNLSLGEGFTPSGSLLRALMALSAEPLEGGTHGGVDLGVGPDDSQGWGRLNLSKIIDFDALEDVLTDNASKPTDVWIHDSYRMADDSWQDLVRGWVGSGPDNVSDAVATANWHGVGAAGPFLATGDYAGWAVTPELDQDLDLRLAWTSRPNPELLDKLVLTVWYRNEEGWHYTCGNDFEGYYSIIHEEEDFEETCFNATSDHIDTVSGVRVSADTLVNASYISIGVYAEHVSVGNDTLTIGIDGDRIGFSVATKGIDETNVWWAHAPMVEVLAPNDGDELTDVIEVEFIAGHTAGYPVMAFVGLKNWDDGENGTSNWLGECQSFFVIQWMVNKCTLHLQYHSHLPEHINNTSVFVRVWVVTGGEPQYNTYDTAESERFSFSRTPPECPLCNIELEIPESAKAGENVRFRVTTDETPAAEFWGEVHSLTDNITWNFGDGESATGRSVYHKFSEVDVAGEKPYGVTVCIEYPGGATFCDGAVIMIESDVGPTTPDVSGWLVEGSILVFLLVVFLVIMVMVARYPNRPRL